MTRSDDLIVLRDKVFFIGDGQDWPEDILRVTPCIIDAAHDFILPPLPFSDQVFHHVGRDEKDQAEDGDKE